MQYNRCVYIENDVYMQYNRCVYIENDVYMQYNRCVYIENDVYMQYNRCVYIENDVYMQYNRCVYIENDIVFYINVLSNQFYITFSSVNQVSEDRKIVDKTAFSVGQSIAGVTGLFNNALIATAEKVIICPEMDALIEECADCQMGLPKAFLADPEEMEDRRPLRGNEGKASDKKRKKFGTPLLQFLTNHLLLS